jgi:hypothetical protein
MIDKTNSLKLKNLKFSSKYFPPNKSIPRHREGQAFFRGPIIWGWVVKASNQPGKAFHVAIALWHQCELSRNAIFKVRPSLVREMGVGRSATYKALDALEGAGLIAVTRLPGQAAVVEIIDFNDQPEASAESQPFISDIQRNVTLAGVEHE